VQEGTIMAVHWVNYDLNKSGQDYEKLIAYLKSHNSWARPVRNSFFVDTNLSAGELRDGIKTVVDGNDSVMVVTVTGQGWGSFNVPKEVTDWLRAHL
jgi:hypothetical protein